MIKRVLEIGERLLFPNNIYCLVCGAMIDESRPYSLCDKCVRQLHWITGGRQADGKLQRVCAKCGNGCRLQTASEQLLFQHFKRPGRFYRITFFRLRPGQLLTALGAIRQVLFYERTGLRFHHVFRIQRQQIPYYGTGQFHDFSSIFSLILARAL